jgi:putative addiction module component (TIGR02574 family)
MAARAGRQYAGGGASEINRQRGRGAENRFGVSPLRWLYLSKVIDWWPKSGAGEINMNADSLFDLTPPEKLQLVEDLWDDLAAIPSDVPVHDWQKEELARRKANLLNKPSSGISWQDVKARIRSRYGR